MTIGEKIKHKRKAQGYTLEQLAKAVGVTPSTVSKYEKGSINIPNKQIEKLALALHCSPAYFMGWDEKEEEKEELKVAARNGKVWDRFDKLTEARKKVVTDLINSYFDCNMDKVEKEEK